MQCDKNKMDYPVWLPPDTIFTPSSYDYCPIFRDLSLFQWFPTYFILCPLCKFSKISHLPPLRWGNAGLFSFNDRILFAEYSIRGQSNFRQNCFSSLNVSTIFLKFFSLSPDLPRFPLPHTVLQVIFS